MTVHKATCMLCEASCGLSVELEGAAVRSVRGDRDDSFSRGHICPKATAIPDVMSDPDRIREPLKRQGDGFVPISWEQALQEIGERVAEIQKRDGRNALGLYLGNPTVHSAGAIFAIPYFVRALGTRARFSATSVDQLPHMLTALNLFGHQLLMPVPDIDRCKLLLVFGGNPIVSNGSIMTAPDITKRLKDLRERGGRIIVLDPRRSETAKVADEHHFVRPGGDAALMLGMLHTLFAEGLVKPGRLAEICDGLDALAQAVSPFTPERVAPRAGVEPELIRRLARELASTEHAAVYGRMGTSVQEFGGLASWLTVVLTLVTGNLDKEGGMMFTRPAADTVGFAAMTGLKGHFGVWHSRVRKLPEFGGELPVVTLAEEMDTPGQGQMKALITHAGNPVLSSPNGPRLEKALANLELMVSIDVYRNETTRYAHYILPTRFGFERDHYDLVFNLLAVRNVAKFSPAFMDAPQGVRDDYEVLLDLATSIRKAGGGKPDWALGVTLRVMRWLGWRRLLDMLLRIGPHKGLSLKKLLDKPEGVDLGALQPELPARLFTANKRIPVLPPSFAEDLRRLAQDLDTHEPGLLLIGRRQLRSNNSWLHNSHRLVKGKPSCTLIMHPQDASARGLADGQLARVRSRVGQLEVPVVVSDEIAPGVVSLPHGWGHGRQGAALSVAGAHAGVSINDLTDELRIDSLTGNAALSGTPVDVEALGAVG